VKSDAQLTAKVRRGNDVKLNRAARRKDDGRRKIAKGPVAVADAEARDVQQRLALKGAACPFVIQGVEELYALWWRFHSLKEFSKFAIGQDLFILQCLEQARHKRRVNREALKENAFTNRTYVHVVRC